MRAHRAFVITLFLSACGGGPVLAPTTMPLARPSETHTAPPQPEAGGSPTPGPLTESTPPIVLEPPFVIPSATPRLVTAPLPLEKISIILPGPGSQITSPLEVIGRSGPSWDQRVHLRILGEDGRELNRATTYILALPEASGRFTAALAFSVEGVAEAARLEIVTDSLRTGRMAHLASLDLILLSVGAPLIHPGDEGPEKIAIFAPRDGARVSGGRVTVRGAGWVNSDVPLQVQVLDRAGTVVGSAEVSLDSPAVGQLGTFQVEVAYSIPSAQFGRIAVWEPGTTIPGIVHYNSLEVYLEP
ncbi:MAG: Gmad2 immunoglobulin-like domain-containing protein [Anaerolineales bacterium]